MNAQETSPKVRKKVKKSTSIWISVIAVCTIGFAQSRGGGRPVQVDTVSPQRTNPQVILALNGTLEPIFESSVSSSISPTRVIKLNVDEGDLVQRGQVLVELDPETLQTQRDQAKASLDIAIINLSRAEIQRDGARESARLSRASLEDPSDLVNSRDQAAGNLKVEEEKVKQARAAFAKIAEGGRTEEINRAESSVASAQAKLEERNRNLERNRALFEADAISKAALERAELDTISAKQDLVSAKASLELIKKSRKQDIDEYAARLNAAEASKDSAQRTLINVEKSLNNRYSLRSASNQNKTDEAAANMTIASAIAEVERAKSALEQIEVQLAQTKILSPITGVVSRRRVNSGETAQTGVELLRITTNENFRAIADVDEKYLWQIKVGQKVEISSEAFPDMRVPAEIESIGHEANPSQGTVQVRISILKPDTRFRADLNLDINITTATYEKTIVLPSSAVMREGEVTSIMVVKDGVATKVAVKAGQQSDAGTIIDSGLEESDIVILEPRAIKEGAKVSSKRP